VKFECSHCGKKYSSADDPTPGRVYVIGCKCGHSIVVKGPEKPHPAAASRPFAPASAPATAPPLVPPAASHARRPAAIVPPPPSLDPEPAGPAPFPEAGARRGRAGPSLDPFSDMQEHSGQTGARPLADVPEVKGRIPEPTPTPRSFDPFAAQQGLLLEEDVARSIQGAPTIPAQVGPDADEVPVTFSERLPVAPPPRAPALRLRRGERAERPPGPGGSSFRLATGIAIGAVAVAAVAGASWFFFLRPATTRPPAPASAPAPAAPLAAPAPAPAPVPAAPRTAAPVPAPEPAPPPVAVAAPPPRAEPQPAPAPPAPARTPPEREPPKRAAATRPQKKAAAPAPEPVVAAARPVTPPPAREPAPPPPPAPAPAEPPRSEPAARPKVAAAAPDKKMLDLLGAKQDAPAAPPPAAAARRGEGDGLSPAEVESAVKKNRKAFDSCVEDAVRNEPGLQVLGRRVGLYLTVNPSGIVTAPRLDDPELLETELGACLKSTARKMVFPQFVGDPFQVKVPLVLGQ